MEKGMIQKTSRLYLSLSRPSARMVMVWLTAVFSLLLFTSCQTDRSAATTTPCSATGLCVAEVFQPFYLDYGGQRIFGLPHRDAYTDQNSGRTIQYFDNVRLEYDRTADQVVVTKLGEWALEPLRRDRPAVIPDSTPRLENAFGTFYAQNYGPVVLGAPLTNQIEEGQLRVQYFENGRLEWHPEAQVSRQVQLTPLGQSHFLLEGSNRGIDIIAITDVQAQSAEVTAAVSAPILYQGDTQILYVIAEDANNGLRLSDLVVTLEMRFSDGTPTQIQIIDQPTNSLGLTQAQLDLPEMNAGTAVEVLVKVAYPDAPRPIGQTTTTFQTWW